MALYKKRTAIVEAFQWTGGNYNELKDWTGQALNLVERKKESFFINALKCEMMVNLGDYIIKLADGEFYSCKPDIFEQTYEFLTFGKY